MTDEITIHDLSEEERIAYAKRHRKTSNNCEDGRCGGCPACLEAQGYVEEES